MPELSDGDILDIIDFERGWTASDEEADRAIAHIRLAVTLLPEGAHCAIDSVVPFVTAVAVVLTSVPKYDSLLPLETRITPSHVHRRNIAQVAEDIMGLTGRGGVGSTGVTWALEMAIQRGWLRERWSERPDDPCRQELEPTIVGRRFTFTIDRNNPNLPTLPTASIPPAAQLPSVTRKPGGEQVTVRPPTSAATVLPPRPTHSPDYTSVNWHGTQYTFKPGLQANAVRHLWEAWENGTPTLHQDAVGKLVGSEAERFRFADVFRKHPAFGTMIVPAGTGKGVFRLNASPPTDVEKPTAT